MYPFNNRALNLLPISFKKNYRMAKILLSVGMNPDFGGLPL